MVVGIRAEQQGIGAAIVHSIQTFNISKRRNVHYLLWQLISKQNCTIAKSVLATLGVTPQLVHFDCGAQCEWRQQKPRVMEG